MIIKWLLIDASSKAQAKFTTLSSILVRFYRSCRSCHASRTDFKQKCKASRYLSPGNITDKAFCASWETSCEGSNLQKKRKGNIDRIIDAIWRPTASATSVIIWQAAMRTCFDWSITSRGNCLLQRSKSSTASSGLDRTASRNDNSAFCRVLASAFDKCWKYLDQVGLIEATPWAWIACSLELGCPSRCSSFATWEIYLEPNENPPTRPTLLHYTSTRLW